MKIFPFAASPCRLFQNALGLLLLLLIGLALTGCNTGNITATPNPLDFGAVVYGQQKDQTLSVTFVSILVGTYIAVDSGANPGDFQIVSQNCIGGMGTCSAVIRFKPTAVGLRTATLTIRGNGPGPGAGTATYTRTVPLTGTATQPCNAALAGAALQFDGTTNSLTVSHSSALNAYPLTAEMWVSTKQTTGDIGLINKYVGGTQNGWQVFLHNGLLNAFYFRDNANYVWDGTAHTFSGGSIADGTWHHIAFVVDNSGGSLYVDGTLKTALHGTALPARPRPCRIWLWAIFRTAAACLPDKWTKYAFGTRHEPPRRSSPT